MESGHISVNLHLMAELTVVLTNIFLECIQELHRLSVMVGAERLQFAAIQTNFSNVVFEQETNQAFFSNLSALSANMIFWVSGFEVSFFTEGEAISPFMVGI